MADKQISQLVAATTINDEDLFVMQQGGTAKKLSGQKLADFVYQSAADQIERVDEAVEQAEAAVEHLEEQKNEIAQVVASMAELGTDTTLSTPGMAADAAATGVVKDTALARFEQTEITGVSIATFNDGADNVPVKKLVVDVNPVQDLHGYSNPWPAGGGLNKFDQSTVTFGKWIEQTGAVIDTSYSCISTNISVTSGNVYGIKCYGNTPASMCIVEYASGDTFIKRTRVAANTVLSTTLDASTVYVIVEFSAASTSSITADILASYKAVFYAGSTAPTSYLPFSNICPITGWTGANITTNGSDNIFDGEVEDGYINVDTGENADSSSRYRCKNYIPVRPNTTYYFKVSTYALANNAVTRFYYYDQNKNLIISPSGGTSSRSFTTQSNCFYFRFWVNTAVSNFDNTISINYPSTNTSYNTYVAGNTYSIAFPDAAGTVYGGTLDVTNRKLVVDRAYATISAVTGLYGSAPTGFTGGTVGVPDMKPNSRANGLCDCLKPDASPSTVTVPSICFGAGTTNRQLFLMMQTSLVGNTVESVTTYLASNPVHVVYYLNNIIEYDLTLTEVTTLLGLNNIWVDTGNINDLIYRKMPIPVEELENTLESMIAGVEHTMEATQNYTEGDLVIAVHKLYHIDSNIASGETLVPGTNCRITTIADELTNIMAIVDGYFNALGNLATLNYQVVT